MTSYQNVVVEVLAAAASYLIIYTRQKIIQVILTKIDFAVL